jgi:multidrug efflux pump
LASIGAVLAGNPARHAQRRVLHGRPDRDHRPLAAKNAILIIEFAKDLQMPAGKSLAGCHHRGSCILRFRPILMTSLAFTLGVLPLAIATGASSGSQRAIGTGVMGGMISATVLAIFFVPVFFVFVMKLFRRTTLKPIGSDTTVTPAE